jgi:hypothetical protein
MPTRSLAHVLCVLGVLLLGACSRVDPAAATSRGNPAPRTWFRPDSPSFAQFRPSHHGFRFPNRFKGSPLPVSLGPLEKYVSVPNTFGLCGGMSFAAADYYLANIEPPNDTEPPAKGNPLYSYLYTRQLESLGSTLTAVPKFARWMDLPDATPFGTSALTCLGLDDLRDRVAAGQPVHLGLVLTSSKAGGVLWENHQVLAYAAERSPGSGMLVHIYDPNFPGNDGAGLHLRWKSAGQVVLGSVGFTLHTFPWPAAEIVRKAPGRKDTRVRGFFLMDYSPRIPPQP